MLRVATGRYSEATSGLCVQAREALPGTSSPARGAFGRDLRQRALLASARRPYAQSGVLQSAATLSLAAAPCCSQLPLLVAKGPALTVGCDFAQVDGCRRAPCQAPPRRRQYWGK